MSKFLAALFLLCTTFSAFGTGSSGSWFEVQTPHFVVLTDSNGKQAIRLATQFEQMRTVFHTLIPNANDGHSPIVVLALKDKKGFQALEPESYLAKNHADIAGMFMRGQDKNYILVRLDTEGAHPYSVVYHEYTHFMTSKATWIPLWLSEGLAEFYENTDIREKEVLLGEPNPNEMLYLREIRLLPLTTLFTVDYASPYYHQEQKASDFYAESWALTHYLELTDYEKKAHRLQDYARLLAQGKDPVAAAQQAFGDLKQLQQNLEGYVRRGPGDLKMFEMKTDVTADVSAFHLKELPQAEADAVRADVMIRNNRFKDAETLLTTSLDADPKNANAREAMGLLKFRAGDYESAKKWYGEAVQLDSRDCLAHYYYAMISLKAGDRDHDAAIESSLRASIKLNPEFAPAYDALASFFASRDKNLSEAHLLNAQAIELEPENLNYRMNASSVLSQQRQYSSAIGVLKFAKRMAKTPGETAMIDNRIQQLEHFQAALEKAKTSEGGAESVSSATAQPATPSDPTKTIVFRRVDGKVIGKVEETPNYPTGPATGPRHKVHGIIRDVRCSYPNVLSLKIDEGSRSVPLYNNNYYKIEFATANYTPDSDIEPCTDIEGMKATVEYSAVTDKLVAGQIVSIELAK